ncbi:hypothetical protein CFIMG_007194RA00001 [Ceratocystis fimbriata CBS 114723]|uniref:Uncharacterized protein n=1 Tax=Ceratocystis fimbriata CBS 114723 TaxID=1035309 RepID=A0A2C5XBD4_9PEZI|nr:hypothetical protein CFIMG_007194RA00001 [Ceratocystis fimbriata CBS 114723]
MAASVSGLSLCTSTTLLLVLLSFAICATAQTNGTLETYTLYGCDSSSLGFTHSYSQAADNTCLGTAALSFKVVEPATCANGTRAKLARFEGSRCNNGQVTVAGGLVDIADSDIGQCLTTNIANYSSDAEHESIKSISFFCDGPEAKDTDGDGDIDSDDLPKGPKAGSVSDSACPRVGASDTAITAPFFDHPYPDQCSYIMADRKLRVYSSATCVNGTAAKLAVWSGVRQCQGEPSILTNVTDELMGQCLVFNTTRASSYSFFCNGMDAKGKAKSAAAIMKQQTKSIAVVLSLLLTAAVFSSL